MGMQLCYSAGHPINAFRAEILDALNESNKLTALALHAAFSRRPSSTSTRAKGRYRQNALLAYEGTPFPAQDMPSFGTHSERKANVSNEK